MARSRSITPEMPADLLTDFVVAVNVGAFEDVFDVEDVEGGEEKGPMQEMGTMGTMRPSVQRGAIRERCVEHVKVMPEIEERLGLDEADQTLALALAVALDISVHAGTHAGYYTTIV
jgi:hypothetical protein